MADREKSGFSPRGLRGLRGLWAGLGLTAALLVTSCSGIGSDGGGCSASACGFVTTAGAGIAGCATYEDRLYGTAGFTGRRFAPVRFAEVELLAAGTVIDTAHTDGDGAYCLAPLFTPSVPVSVRLKSVSKPPRSPAGGGGVRVLEPRTGEPYFFESTPVRAKQGDVVTVPTMAVRLADDQIDPGRVLLRNEGGAFNILDVASGGFQFVQGNWQKALPELVVTWRANAASGTFFLHRDALDPKRQTDRINIKGVSTNDSDEYDDDVILHEFGHFALWVLSEDSSPGGRHFINGANQDTRLAWSEGWANFFSTMVRDVNAAGFSNRSGLDATIIDAFGLTEGSQSALRFSYELTEPQAFLPDQSDPVNPPTAVDNVVFRDLTKYSTSEVSVAVALWDIYKGGRSQSISWPGLGVDGMLAVIAHIPQIRDPLQPVTFATFWKAYVDLFPAQSDAVIPHFLADRLLSLVDDEWGADDTRALADLLTLTSERHFFNNLQPGVDFNFKGHTLFPEGDVDLFLLDVTAPGVMPPFLMAQMGRTVRPIGPTSVWA